MRVSRLLVILLLPCALHVQGQTPLQPESQSSRAQASTLVDQLSLEFGRNDYRLLEPLSAYAQLLLEDGQFEETHDVLDRAAQIARIHEGLYAQSQFPFILAKITNYANSGDWTHARELMEHLLWLLARDENVIDDNLIDALMTLTDLHLRGVAEDNAIYQGYHFRAALQPNRLAVVYGQRSWGRFDTRVAPMLYKLAVQHYLHAQTVDIGGKTSSVLRTYTGSGATRSRADSRRNSYYLGLRYLSEIRNIYRNQENPDPTAIALSDMYIADWQVLFTESEAARSGYARTFSGLVQAGVDRDVINDFFARPVMLPAEELQLDWNQEVSALPDRNAVIVEAPEDQPVELGFQEWSPTIPYLHMPLDYMNTRRDTAANGDMAIFSFSLTGLEEISRWNRGRRKAAVGAAQELEIIKHTFTGGIDQEALREQMRAIRFRPKLVNGVPQTVNATLQYQTASAN